MKGKTKESRFSIRRICRYCGEEEIPGCIACNGSGIEPLRPPTDETKPINKVILKK